MKWKKVDHLCHGLHAKVRFTMVLSGQLQELEGIIICERRGDTPYLRTNICAGGMARTPGPNDLVILKY